MLTDDERNDVEDDAIRYGEFLIRVYKRWKPDGMAGVQNILGYWTEWKRDGQDKPEGQTPLQFEREEAIKDAKAEIEKQP